MCRRTSAEHPRKNTSARVIPLTGSVLSRNACNAGNSFVLGGPLASNALKKPTSSTWNAPLACSNSPSPELSSSGRGPTREWCKLAASPEWSPVLASRWTSIRGSLRIVCSGFTHHVPLGGGGAQILQTVLGFLRRRRIVEFFLHKDQLLDD